MSVHRGTTLAGALALVSTLLSWVPAEATIIRPFDLVGLAYEAHVVVHGEVVAQESRWSEDGSRIYTYSEVTVRERVKGTDVPETVLVKQIGGTVDEVTMQVPGTAQIVVGDEVVLFLRTDGIFHYLVGMHQGHYAVQRSAEGLPWVARGAASHRRPKSPGVIRASAAQAVEIPLATFLDDVRALSADKPWLPR